MTEVLSTTDTTGSFTATGGHTTVLVDTFVDGNPWILQVESPNKVWVNTDIVFTGVGIQDFTTVAGLAYRLSGGAMGARAYVSEMR